MESCTFFGHKDTPWVIESALRSTLTDLIENQSVTLFFVGNHGAFDAMVRRNLKRLKAVYPHIRYAVVPAYLPGKRKDIDYGDDTVYPEGLENTPRRFAIVKRNKWMIDHSDYVVTYVRHDLGGAAQFKKIAEKKEKIVINLADREPDGKRITAMEA